MLLFSTLQKKKNSSKTVIMKNTISQRVADFLKNYPPFSFLSLREINTLSEEVSIIYKEKDSIVFEENEAAHDSFYVIHKGAVALKKGSKNEIINISDEGDLIGLRPLITHENYKMEARAHEESILYAIPSDLFKPYALKNKDVANFLIESFASNTENPYSESHRGKLYGEVVNEEILGSSQKLLDFQPVKYSKKIITCTPSTPANSIAEMMTKKNVGAILVVENEFPIGIVTDKDLRNKIVTGAFPITAQAQCH